jgi:hypothetical protein
MKTHHIFLKAIAATSLLLGLEAQAQLLYYEGFNYTSGSSLTAQNGGTGWGGAWTANGSGETISTPGFTYTDGSGNVLLTSPGDGIANFVSGNNGNFRALGTTLGTAGSTVYISFLDQVSSSTLPYAGLSLFNGTSTENEFLGQPGGPTTFGFAGTVSGQSSTPVTDLSLLVYEINFSGTGETVSLFVDPTLGVQPATADATGTSGTAFTFDTIRIQSGGLTADGPAGISELRIGDTFSDVTPFSPVPEPTTMALSILGGLGAVHVIRRRRTC